MKVSQWTKHKSAYKKAWKGTYQIDNNGYLELSSRGTVTREGRGVIKRAVLYYSNYTRLTYALSCLKKKIYAWNKDKKNTNAKNKHIDYKLNLGAPPPPPQPLKNWKEIVLTCQRSSSIHYENTSGFFLISVFYNLSAKKLYCFHNEQHNI